ncbi:MAG: hypothetical protein NUV55_01965 [Sulfuricaulis sp.]|uniref:hypothetical protein n=1 Tax=Sulfuricaulis sp. TaxID=2003553 RepID=UPI0026003F5B|nr:hypothetical protein [Sulfuricaulis sp.]MCR4345963.1 hypothetical protein [Sulfuricaulis sp.]
MKQLFIGIILLLAGGGALTAEPQKYPDVGTMRVLSQVYGWLSPGPVVLVATAQQGRANVPEQTSTISPSPQSSPVKGEEDLSR